MKSNPQQIKCSKDDYMKKKHLTKMRVKKKQLE